MNTSLHELIPVLQVAVGPVILISGVGLLLLTMTNRLGRLIDRSRLLLHEEQHASGPTRAALDRQITILGRRAVLVRRAIFLASLSVLMVAVLIILLFGAALLDLHVVPLLVVIFAGSMAALIVSLVAFLQDVQLSLQAIQFEMQRTRSAKTGEDA